MRKTKKNMSNTMLTQTNCVIARVGVAGSPGCTTRTDVKHVGINHPHMEHQHPESQANILVVPYIIHFAPKEATYVIYVFVLQRSSFQFSGPWSPRLVLDERERGRPALKTSIQPQLTSH